MRDESCGKNVCLFDQAYSVTYYVICTPVNIERKKQTILPGGIFTKLDFADCLKRWHRHSTLKEYCAELIHQYIPWAGLISSSFSCSQTESFQRPNVPPGWLGLLSSNQKAIPYSFEVSGISRITHAFAGTAFIKQNTERGTIPVQGFKRKRRMCLVSKK